MAEAVAVIGGIAACSQLARYGTGLAKFLFDYPTELRSIPTTVDDLIDHLEWHLSIMRSLGSSSSNHVAVPTVQPIITRSIRLALSLQQLLKPLVVETSDKGAKRLKKALAYQRKARKITKFRSDLESCERRLLLHFSTISYRRNLEENGGPYPSLQVLHGPRVPPRTLLKLPPRLKFVGRESTIDLVSQALVDPNQGNKACLVGPGGIGKSHTAIECAYRIYDSDLGVSIIWIQASNQSILEESLDQLGRELNLRAYNENGRMTFQKLIDWFDADVRSRWILIVDDVDLATFGDSTLLQHDLSKSKNGSILFTTRSMWTAASLEQIRLILPLESLSTREASQLLESQLNTSSWKGEDLTPLLSHLDYLPLAIIHAAEFMRLHPISPHYYLELFRANEERYTSLLAPPAPSSICLNNPISPAILSIVPMDIISRQNEAAAQLISLMACLGSAKIPRRLLDIGQNSLQATQALDLLKAYSIVSSDDGDETFIMPRLVRLSVRFYLNVNRVLQIYACHVLRLVSRNFPSIPEQYAKIEECKLHLPHALAILEEVVKSPISSEHCQCPAPFTRPDTPWDFTGPLALRVSFFLRILGNYKSALQLAAQASLWLSSADASQTSPVENLICEGDITTLIHFLGHPIVFAAQIDKIFHSQTILLKAHRPLTIIFLRQKGHALQARGHPDKAEAYHRRAITIAESIYGPQDTKLLDEKHDLALCLLGQKRVREGLADLQQIFTKMTQLYGFHDIRTLDLLGNIGGALQLHSLWDDAQKALVHTLAGRERVLGTNHPYTIQTRANLAQICIARGDLLTAERLILESLHQYNAEFGETHHISLHLLNNLGFVLLHQRRYGEAGEILRSVAEKRESVLGADHADTLASAFYACDAFYREKRFEEALDVGRRVLWARRRTLEVEHVDRRAVEAKVAEIEIEFDEWVSGRTLVGEGRSEVELVGLGD